MQDNELPNGDLNKWSPLKSKEKKEHSVPLRPTSNINHHINQMIGLYAKEEKIVLQFLAEKKQPLNSNMISIYRGLPRTNVTRCLCGLEKKGALIKVGDSNGNAVRCPITNRPTGFYWFPQAQA